MNILITGTAGYIGGMLAHQFSQREDIKQVICVDKEAQPDWLPGSKKIVWIQANLAQDNWQLQIPETPSVVIHCAWQIRDLYGKRDMVYQWNHEGSRRVFDYVFADSQIERLVYFSSIAQFGAEKANTLEDRFDHSSAVQESGYAYADDKYHVDMLLQDLYQTHREHSGNTKVTVIKPSTVTGPRGRIGVGKFSLAAALSADADKSAIPRPIQWMLSRMPIVGRWARQFVHEDDITDIVAHASFEPIDDGMHTYIASPNDIITGTEMATMMQKKSIRIPGRLAQLGFSALWHMTRGYIPTAPGVWKFFAYPICVDGSAVCKDWDYTYQYTSKQAISELKGRYADNE